MILGCTRGISHSRQAEEFVESAVDTIARKGRYGTNLFLVALVLGFLALLPASASAASDFNATSCTSSEFCLTVGSTGPSGSGQILIDKWNCSTWTKPSHSHPSGATENNRNPLPA